MSIGFMGLRARMADDGVHVEVAHDCLDERVESWLPWPTWHASPDGKTVEPSIHCKRCGTHGFAFIEAKAT